MPGASSLEVPAIHGPSTAPRFSDVGAIELVDASDARAPAPPTAAADDDEAAGADASVSDEELQKRIEGMERELDMPAALVEDLLRLSGTDIVVLADDSGSMNRENDAAGATRWSELRHTLHLLVSMLVVVEHAEGFSLKFLNGNEYSKIATADDLDRVFEGKPRARGKTPLLANLAPVIKGFGEADADTLVLIFTDGEPSDCEFDELTHLIKSKCGARGVDGRLRRRTARDGRPSQAAERLLLLRPLHRRAGRRRALQQGRRPLPGLRRHRRLCRGAARGDGGRQPAHALPAPRRRLPFRLCARAATPRLRRWLAKMVLTKEQKHDDLDERELDRFGRRVRPCCAVS